MNINETTHLQEWIHQGRRQDHVTDSKRWKEHFAKGSNVDDAVCLIKPLQSGQWTCRKPELAVIVIFKDESVCTFRPIQQCQSPRERHRHSQRELMRRSEIDQSRLWRTLDPDLYHQTFMINRNRNNICAYTEEGASRAGV